MHPLGLLQEGERQAGLLGQSQALWKEAPAWRLLVVSTAVLCAASIASPLLLSEQTGPQPIVAQAPASPSSHAAPPSPSAPPPTTMSPQIAAPQKQAAAEPAPALPPAPLPSLITPWTPPLAALPTPAPLAEPLPRSAPTRHHHQAAAHVAALPDAPEAASPTKEDTCGMLPLMGRGGQGEIISFLTRAQAATVLERSQANVGGKISPHYLTNLRAVISVTDAGISRRVFALVPHGMVVNLGDRVVFTQGHRDWTMPCNYIPNLISGLAPAVNADGK